MYVLQNLKTMPNHTYDYATEPIKIHILNPDDGMS